MWMVIRYSYRAIHVIHSFRNHCNKIEAEQNDYNRLLQTGIRIPRMLDIDVANERILKEYIDYECNNYMDEWNFENWGIKYWSKTTEFIDYMEQH